MLSDGLTRVARPPFAGVGVEDGTAVGVGVEDGIAVGVTVDDGVAVGVSVEDGVAVGVGVPVAVLVEVAAAASKLNPFESLDGLYCAVPAKFALIVTMPLPEEVTWQVALPLESVVPEHPAPFKLKLTV